jgi:hypothetical protein
VTGVRGQTAESALHPMVRVLELVFSRYLHILHNHAFLLQQLQSRAQPKKASVRTLCSYAV